MTPINILLDNLIQLMMIITIVINMMMELTKEKISWYERRRGFSDDGRPLISGWPRVQYLPCPSLASSPLLLESTSLCIKLLGSSIKGRPVGNSAEQTESSLSMEAR